MKQSLPAQYCTSSLKRGSLSLRPQAFQILWREDHCSDRCCTGTGAAYGSRCVLRRHSDIRRILVIIVNRNRPFRRLQVKALSRHIKVIFQVLGKYRESLRVLVLLAAVRPVDLNADGIILQERPGDQTVRTKTSVAVTFSFLWFWIVSYTR